MNTSFSLVRHKDSTKKVQNIEPERLSSINPGFINLLGNVGEIMRYWNKKTPQGDCRVG